MLASPVAQEIVALQITWLARVLLDMKVGPVALLTDPRDRVHPDDTLHSVEQRRNLDFDKHYTRARVALLRPPG